MAIQQPATPARSKRPGIVTPRDVAMLRSLSVARYLTAEALEWLHVPTWRARWDRHQAATPPRPYYPMPHLYRRLLMLTEQGLIDRVLRSTQVGVAKLRRLADALYLTEAGAHVVHHLTGEPLESLLFVRRRRRSYITLNHSVLIGQVYAALQAKMHERGDVEMHGWQCDYQMIRDYDQVTIVRPDSAGKPQVAEVGIQPDATFDLRHPGGSERVFVEVDRETRNLRTWVEKILAYQEYLGSPQLQARYGTSTFLLLTVTTSEHQRLALMRATAGVIGQASHRYLFAVDQAIHPTRIGTSWLKIAEARPVRNAPFRPDIRTEAHTFLR